MNNNTDFSISISPITVGDQPISLHDVVAISLGAKAILPQDAKWQQRIENGAAYLERILREEGVIYGVTTGYGDSCVVEVPPSLVPELPLHLSRYHGCGMGEYFNEQETRAVLAARLNSLAQGYSGVRPVLLTRLTQLIEHNILPLIPSEGSVGASGDLTPLSYVAATLVGERDVVFRGAKMPASVALAQCDIEPITLAPKEGLAIMNGTAVMTGLACLAWQRAEYLTRLTSRITAGACLAMQGNPGHFDPRLFAVKPHQGQGLVAKRIFDDLSAYYVDHSTIRLQDRYSIRCAPHVIGVLQDALGWMQRDIENELNSANDNPIIDGEEGVLLHGGHFYGGHIAFVMDSMKNAVANLADLMDRQLALLVDTRYNHGLPQNLSGTEGLRASINHGLKAVQIGTSAWTAEALKLTMPASVFSRSTECHNQDKVSMGTIAARDCLRVLTLTEQVAAALSLAVAQALNLRLRSGNLQTHQLGSGLQQFVTDVNQHSPFIDEDRMLEHDLRALLQSIQTQSWSLSFNV